MRCERIAVAFEIGDEGLDFNDRSAEVCEGISKAVRAHTFT